MIQIYLNISVVLHAFDIWAPLQILIMFFNTKVLKHDS